MNRHDRRRLGVTKGTADRLEELKKPCSVLECINLAQGVAEDAISNYHKSLNPIIVSLSIQIEVLKELLFSGGVVSQTEFEKMFEERVNDYNAQKEQALKNLEEISEESAKPQEDVSGDVKTEVNPMPMDINVTSK